MSEFENIREVAEFLRPIYQSNNWEWGFGNSAHVPTVEELETRINDLIRDLGDKVNDNISTGRITILRTLFGPEVTLSLYIPS